MYAFLFRLSGDEELVRERMCCAIALSLSLSFTLSKHTDQVPVWRRETHKHSLSKHENTKLPFERKKKKDKKWPLVSYILVSNKRKKKNIVQTGILLTQTNHRPSVTLTFIHIHKNIHFYN